MAAKSPPDTDYATPEEEVSVPDSDLRHLLDAIAVLYIGISVKRLAIQANGAHTICGGPIQHANAIQINHQQRNGYSTLG